MFLLGLVSFDRFFCPVTSFTPIRRPSRKNVASTFTFSLLPDRPPNVTGRGRRSQSRTHTRQTYKAIWRTKRTSCVYCFSHHTSRLNQIRFKGGGVVSVSSFLILNTEEEKTPKWASEFCAAMAREVLSALASKPTPSAELSIPRVQSGGPQGD